MDIQKQRLHGCCLIEVTGDIDTTSSPMLQASLEEELGLETRQFIIDLSGTRYMSSMGLRVLLSHLKKLKNNQGSMVLSGCNQLITDIFRMSGFLDYFELTSSKEQALERVATI